MKTKHLLLLLLLAVLVPWAAKAQTPTIAEIGRTSNWSTSTHVLPGPAGYLYTVFLYRPSEAEFMYSDCSISSIAFDVKQHNNTPIQEMTIWIKDMEPDYEIPSYHDGWARFQRFIEGATQVHHSTTSYSPTIGWNTFSFNETDFTHEAGKAILVAMRGVSSDVNCGNELTCYIADAPLFRGDWYKSGCYTDPGMNVEGNSYLERAAIQFGYTLSSTCASPMNLTATYPEGIGTEVTLGWTENGEATAWQICLNDDETNLIEANSNPFTLTGLTPETTYTAKVRANCGDEQSAWSVAMSIVPTFKTMVGTGDASESRLPTTPFQNYSLTQQIYTADELGTAADLVSIDFYNDGTEATTRNFDIYMAHTTQNAFDNFTGNWIGVASGDLVFSGTVNILSKGWTSITFDAPFAYDGQHNVVITVDDNTGSAVTSGIEAFQFLSYSTPNETRQSKFYFGTDNYDPTNNPGAGLNTLYLKNHIRVMKAYAPTDLTVSDVTTNAATLSWTENGTATSWQICLNGNMNDLITVTENPYTLTNLTPNAYTAKVRANCAEGHTSWTNEVSFVPGDWVTIGSGTETNNFLPFRTYRNYSVTQQIYTNEELGVPGFIQSIDFFKTGTLECIRNIDIYMIHTDLDDYAFQTDTWIPVNSDNLVFSGTVTFGDNCWTTIILDTPFAYDGLHNVAIVIDDNTGSYTPGEVPFLSFTTATAQGFYTSSFIDNFPPTSMPESAWGIVNQKNQIRVMKLVPAALPYSTDFETTCDWTFVNGSCANAWAWGTAGHAEGSRGLYISNDGGTSNAYTNTELSVVFAAKTFNFEAGTYIISYDWRANGQEYYDILRVALVPANVVLEASTTWPFVFSYSALPSGWIALDGGSQLYKATEWQTEGKEIEITEAGAYKLVFAWCNDSSRGDNPPAAIDNVSIAPASCLKPSDVQCSDFTVTTATISWTDNSDASAWQISLNDDESYFIDATTNPFTLSGLDGNTSYSVKMRANCGGDDGYSVWTDPITVNTDQYAVGTGPLSSIHQDQLPIYVYSNYSLSQQIYTPEELGDAGTIESIAFYMFGGPSRLLRRPFRIYMKYTDKDDYGNNFSGGISYVSNAAFIPVTDADMVRNSGSAGDTETFDLNQWHTVHFDQPFEYDGQHNVVITVWDFFGDFFHVAPTIQNADFFYYVTSTQQQSIATYEVNNVNPMNLSETNPNGFKARDIKNYVKIGKTYPAPGNLQVVSEISGHSASISWTENGTATAWQFCVNGEEHNPIEASSNPFILTGLTPGTPYTVKVRARCDGDFFSGWSNEISFTTLSGYSTDFETTCDWTLVNGDCTNAWTWGEATHNGEGTHGLYISNDGGTTNVYNNTSPSMVYAYKTFRLEAGYHEFSYDWLANGEWTWDFLRVALVPETVNLEASTSLPAGLTYTQMPDGWIALDGGIQLGLTTEWQTVSNDIEVLEAGLYKMVFAWRNDGSQGNNPPAAIDNVSVRQNSCIAPTNLFAANLTSHTADLSWTAMPSINTYMVKYRMARNFNAFFSEDFENGIGDWTLRSCGTLTGINSWAAHSGNAAFCFYFSTNPPQYLISPELTGIAEGMLLEFYYKNHSSTYPETFQVGFSSTNNAIESFTFGDEITVSDTKWHLYSQAIPVGTKYICWKYNSYDMHSLYIDDIVVGTEIPAGEWQTTNVAGGSTQMSFTLSGLSPETSYEAYVYPDCNPDKVSETVRFTTLELTTLTQSISLSEGENWVSFFVETTLNDLKTALVSASNNASGIKITSQNNGYTSWNGSSWKGSLSPFDVRQMYVIEVPAACDFTLEAMPINPAAYPITIVNGINWIGFPLSADMTLTNAFSGFAVNGDKVMSLNGGSATYQGSWSGDLSTLQPGQGYKLEVTTTGQRTFTFPTGAKKATPFNPKGK